jgi:hypothetical protein
MRNKIGRLKMAKFKVYATIYSFVEREVEADNAYDAEEMSIGAGDWTETGSDFDIQRDMTEDITDV